MTAPSDFSDVVGNEFTEGWISLLYTPRFQFLDPDPALIDPRDICHALALLCRFGGHCNRFYSVAEHSIYVAQILELNGADDVTVRAGLLHDAEEAYLPDIPSPIKQHMPEALKIYERLHAAVCTRFNLQGADWARIKDIDKRLCITEAKQLGLWNKNWYDPGPALNWEIGGWLPTGAEAWFIETMRSYGL